jgi:hypothetical protein
MKREELINIYLDWKNNWITIGAFAESNGLTSGFVQPGLFFYRLT